MVRCTRTVDRSTIMTCAFITTFLQNLIYEIQVGRYCALYTNTNWPVLTIYINIRVYLQQLFVRGRWFDTLLQYILCVTTSSIVTTCPKNWWQMSPILVTCHQFFAKIFLKNFFFWRRNFYREVWELRALKNFFYVLKPDFRPSCMFLPLRTTLPNHTNTYVVDTVSPRISAHVYAQLHIFLHVPKSGIHDSCSSVDVGLIHVLIQYCYTVF